MVKILKIIIHKTQVTRPLKNNRGVALILAISSLAFIIYLATEVMYDSTVEYTVNSQELARLKSYYAARGAMELGLLRIKIYQNVKSKLGDKIGDIGPYIDEIWKFPIAWPPMTMDNQLDSDKDQMKKIVTESLMDSNYSLLIQDEGSKIDINDLNSPSEALRKATQQQILNIFEQKIKEDEEFRKKYDSFRFEELVNQMIDWMSSKNLSLNGGDKKNYYRDIVKDDEELPPNRGFRTLAELHMIPMMTDEFYNLLEPRITLFGLKGVNPNTASLDVLRSLDPAITKEVVDEIDKRRTKVPFSNKEDFVDFLNRNVRNLSTKPEDMPVVFETVASFSVKAIGNFGDVAREIHAITLNVDSSVSKLKSITDAEKKDENKDTQNQNNQNQSTNNNQNQNQNQNKSQSASVKGMPRIVFWSEK